jgi:4-hydroxy-tetrahydrodipicolinate synthase
MCFVAPRISSPTARIEHGVASVSLSGVIAAAATPITNDFQPDTDRFVALCRTLLDQGCDGLNICGTTGEATSFTVAQRIAIMRAAAAALPLSRLMVGTGAAALADAVALTKEAAALGFAGALIIPPFYYKTVEDDGVVRLFERLVVATAEKPIDLYLYNFPALSGVPYSPALVSRLCSEFGSRIAGLKDSSGDLDYAKGIATALPKLRVFPSNEAVLLRARAGEFAGCISASANVNPEYCARAYRAGDEAALATAANIRALVSQTSLIASVKAVLAFRRNDPAFEAMMPPLAPLSDNDKRQLLEDVAPLLGNTA